MPRLLLIKTSSLGDVVHNLPAVTDIRARIPDATIDWVVESSFADIPALHPGVRNVIPVGLRRWRQSWWRRHTWREIAAFKKRVQEERYDFVIDTQGLLKSALIARVAHGQRYGQDARSAREPMAAWCYDHRFYVARGRHAVTRNRDLVAQVLDYRLASEIPDYGIRAPKERRPPELAQPYVICFHGTSRESKLWPKPYWVTLAQELLKHGLTPTFPWGNDEEQARARAIAASAPGSVVLPRMPIRRIAVALAHAQGVVGVDTGLVHLAAALNLPTVAIYTDTLPLLTGVLPAQEQRALNLGDRTHIPTPAEARAALMQLGVL